MSNESTALHTESEETSSPAVPKRRPGRPKGTGPKQKLRPAGEWIYDETEELVFVEGAEPADELVCDGALPPGLTVDPDGTRVWNCCAVGGITAIRRRLRQGDPKKGAKLAAATPAIVEMCDSLKTRKRCVRWPGAMVVLQYVFKPQTLDTKLSSPRNAKGSLVALRLSPSVSGFISDILHGPLIIDFADSEVSINVFDNALDIAAWVRKELLAAWSDGKIDESEPVRAVPLGGDLTSGQVFYTDGRPPLSAGKLFRAASQAVNSCIRESLETMTPETLDAAREMVCDLAGDDAGGIQPTTEPTTESTTESTPKLAHPRTVADYLTVPISVKANAEAAEMGTGDTLGAILDAVCGKDGCDWPKWRLGATTEELREVKASGDEQLYKTCKRTKLPVWYPSATWKQPRRARANTENVSGTTGLVCLDFDHFPTPEVATKARDDFMDANMDHVLLCALSASGRGFYAVVCADTGGTVETYKTEAVRLIEWAREQGYDPDTGCCDCTRGRILAVDRDALRMGDDWELTPPVYTMPTTAPARSARAGKTYTNDPTKKPSKAKVVGYVARAVEKITAAPTGGRNTAFTSACGAASRLCDLYDYDRDDAESRLRFAAESSGLDSKEIESVLRRYGPLAGR